MMRKIVTLLLFVVSLPMAYADKEESVELNDADKRTAIVEFASGRLFLEMGDFDAGGSVNVSVAMENISDEYDYLLFYKDYGEKALKKLPVSVVFDKIFAGTKGKRSVEACEALQQDMKVSPSQKSKLLDFSVKAGETATLRVPIYFTTHRTKTFLRKERYVLKEKYVLLLNVTVEQKPDSTYLYLVDEYRKLKKVLDGKVFCTNRRHKPSLARQKSFYEDWKDVCVTQIDSVMETLYSTDARYKLYEGLKENFDAIDLEAMEGDCGKHRAVRASRHHCKYCGWSFQQIYHRLDDYYQRIYSSDNRKEVKEQVMEDVRMLYNCCTDKHCASHVRAWPKSGYRSKIIDRYNRINRF